MWTRVLLVLLVAAVPASAGGATANGVPGALSQLGGPPGCIHDADAATDEEDVPPDVRSACTRGIALQGAYAVGVSPDGRNVYVAALDGASVAAFRRSPVDGGLQQLPGESACLAETGSELPCLPGTALQGLSSIAVSPDGRHAYVTASFSDSVAVLSRDPSTGRITQPADALGCVAQQSSESACAPGLALLGAAAVAISPNGRHVYVAAFSSDGIAIFSRNVATGALAQLRGSAGCVTEKSEVDPDDPTGVPDPTAVCSDGAGLDGASGLAVSPDGRHVYVAAYGANAIAAFARDGAGRLEQLEGAAGCVRGADDGAECARARGLDGPFSIAISRDGRSVYAVGGFSPAHGDTDGDGSLVAFRRDPGSGRLTQLAGRAGCVSATGTEGTCSRARSLGGVQSVTISPDDSTVYVAAAGGDAIAAFARDRATGSLTQLRGRPGCIGEAGGECLDSVGLVGVSSIALSPDGKNAYATSPSSHSVAVFARVRPAAETVRFTARLLPVPRRLAASGSAVLSLQPDSRRLCWRLAQRGLDRVTGARVRVAGRPQIVERLGRGWTRRGCTTIAARWAERLVKGPGGFVLEVLSSVHPTGALRGRLARRSA